MRRSVWFGFAFAASVALLSGSAALADDAAPATPAAPDAATAPPAVKPKAHKAPKPKATDADKPADAASDSSKPAADKPKVSKASVTVSVLNKREVALKWMTAIATGAEGDPKKIIGAVKPGKHGFGHVARTKDCQYDLHGDYEDGSVFEASSVDLCKSGGFNLKD